MPLDSQAHPPRFRLWIRRQNLAVGAYSLRFEAQEGKGILRVARPGVLIDPPARPEGIEERLTPAQLRSTRFILVWDGGRARQTHLLERIEEGQLERIELDRWLDVEIVVDGGFRYASIPISTPPAEARPTKAEARRPSLSELRHALDSMTVRREEGREPALTTDLRPTPVPPDVAAPAVVPAGRVGGALANLADYEVDRPRMAPDPTASSRRVGPAPLPLPPDWLTDATTVALGDEDDTVILPAEDAGDEASDESDVLAMADGDASIEDSESLAMGEADDDPDQVETSELGEAPPPPQAQPAAPPKAPRTSRPPAAETAGGAAAFFAQFNDEEDEAVFSIDLPSHRHSTEHVTVRRGDERDDGAFASEVLPPIRGVVVAPRLAKAALLPAPPEPPPAPPPGLPSGLADPAIDHWQNAATLTAADDGDGIVHRGPTTLVRHLRRRAEEQRARIAELESRIAELEAKG